MNLSLLKTNLKQKLPSRDFVGFGHPYSLRSRSARSRRGSSPPEPQREKNEGQNRAGTPCSLRNSPASASSSGSRRCATALSPPRKPTWRVMEGEEEEGGGSFTLKNTGRPYHPRADRNGPPLRWEPPAGRVKELPPPLLPSSLGPWAGRGDLSGWSRRQSGAGRGRAAGMAAPARRWGCSCEERWQHADGRWGRSAGESHLLLRGAAGGRAVAEPGSDKPSDRLPSAGLRVFGSSASF